jgi:hypothetical protein
MRKFDNTYTKWKQGVPPEEQSWEFFTAVHNLITLHGIYLAPSDMKCCLNYSVIDATHFGRFTRLYNAMKVDYAKSKEVEELITI